MTATDYQLEQFYKTVADRPQRKFEETITSFDRDIFWYDRDSKGRQRSDSTTKTTYEDHRKAIETAVNMMRKDTQHDIAMCILNHRFFAPYRDSVFSGQGSFLADYTFLIKKISMIFNPHTSRINTFSVSTKLQAYTEPTLVQINHIVGSIKEVKTPDTGETLVEWALKFNASANESTTYVVAGLKVGI